MFVVLKCRQFSWQKWIQDEETILYLEQNLAKSITMWKQTQQQACFLWSWAETWIMFLNNIHYPLKISPNSEIETCIWHLFVNFYFRNLSPTLSDHHHFMAISSLNHQPCVDPRVATPRTALSPRHYTWAEHCFIFFIKLCTWWGDNREYRNQLEDISLILGQKVKI